MADPRFKGKFQTHKRDLDPYRWDFLVVCEIKGKRVAMRLNGGTEGGAFATAFAAKHLRNTGMERTGRDETLQQRKQYRDDRLGQVNTNTVIEYAGPSDLQDLVAEMAGAFCKGAWQQEAKSPYERFQEVPVTFGKNKERVIDVGPDAWGNYVTTNRRNTATIKAYLKGESGDCMSIVIKHLNG